VPEIQLFQDSEDEAQLVRTLLLANAHLVPDVDYAERTWVTIRDIETYDIFRSRARLFFVLHESFSRSPLEMVEVEKDGRNIHYISQSSGGPFLDYLAGGVPGMIEESKLASGMLGFKALYWDTVAHCTKRPPAQLVAFYGELAKTIRSSYLKFKPGKVTYYIGPGALNKARSGMELVGLDEIP
jgi:hypothetical protein